jgi:predicted metal-binding membrane protein
VRSPVQVLCELTGAAAAAAGLTGIGWLGLAALSYAGAPTGPICGASPGGSLGEAMRPDRVLAWGLMVLAMMGPLLAGPLYHLWHRSLARHRLRGIALFLSAYVAGWCLACGVFALALDAANAYQAGDAVLLPAAVSLAAAWQLSPDKRYALLRCHLRPPLSVFGTRAWLDPIWFGLRRAFWCVLSCWALMLVSFSTRSGGILPMLIVSAIIAYEQVFREPPRLPAHACNAWVPRPRRYPQRVGAA